MKEIVISKKRLIIVSIIVLILIFLCYVVFSLSPSARYKTESLINTAPTSGNFDGGASQTISTSDIYEEEKMAQPYYDGQPTISDTREFLKTNYSSTINTRDVVDMTKNVHNAVKGADGRIDNFYSSEKRGRVSFVVAKSNFEALRSEIENLTYAKLYVESVSSQNLLRQKQNIESQTTNVLSRLETLQKQKESLNSQHTQTVKGINNEINRINAELANVRSIIFEETDPETLVLFRRQETTLISQQSVQNQKLNSENNNYSLQSKNLDNQIVSANNNLANVNQQDSQFADNIETVNGYVIINWVSWWQLVKIYSPISPSVLIIAFGIILWIFLRHKGYLPRIIVQ